MRASRGGTGAATPGWPASSEPALSSPGQAVWREEHPMQPLIVRPWLVRLLLPVGVVACSILTPQNAVAQQGPRRMLHQVTVPMEDRFTPFSLTIHVGDSVRWLNRDTDDHTVVTDNAFTTTDHRGIDHLLPGTDSTPGGGTFTL